jgi:hypothetical protein
MTDGPRVVAVVPARDSAGSIAATVGALSSIREVGDVLVVDDGSVDGTADVARAAGAWVLRLPENRGKGGAVAAAVAATPETDVYLLVDADTGATAAGAEALLGPVVAGEVDMTVGVLPSPAGRGGLGLVRRLAGTGIRRATGSFVAQAPISGQRAVRGSLLRSLTLAPRFGLEVGLTVDAVRAGGRVVEVPVEMDHRHTGRSVAGFAHRGRQGVDIVRALWPRLTSPRSRTGLLAGALLLAVVAATWSGARAAPSSVPAAAPAKRVLLVGLPGLSWDDVGKGTMPNLDRLVDEGAVAAMNVRTRSAVPTVREGYASLGAGTRVHAGPAADDAVEAGGRIVVPAAGQIRASAGPYLSSLPGALGDALHSAGRRTAVIGTADLPANLTGIELDAHPNVARPAAVALMDRQGVVDGGNVTGEGLLVEGGPFGRRVDLEAVTAQTLGALEGFDVVLVDPGDLERADAVDDIGAVDRYVLRTRADALASADDLLGRLRGSLPQGTLLLVVSVTPPTDEWRLTPVVAAGAGVVPGYLHSPSTRRLGLVALTDLAPTILAALAGAVPPQLPGAVLRYHPGTADLARLARLDRDAAWREGVWLPVTTVFIVLQVGLWFVTGAAVAGLLPWLRRSWLRPAALAVAAFPLAALLVRVLPFVPGMGVAGLAVLVALDLALAAVAARAVRHPLAGLAWLLGVTLALLLVDVATGARLQLAGLLGYSPQSASRFYGLGNTAFGVLAGATLLAGALHVARAPRRREAVAASAALFAFVVYVDVAPVLGADVGGMVTLVPICVLVVVGLAGLRLTRRRLALAALATAGVLGLATTVDLLRPPDARTHLGRLASSILRWGDDSLLDTLVRRVEVTVEGVGDSFWTFVTPVIAVLVLAALLWSRQGRALVPPGSPLRAGVLGALAAGLVGTAVNDSGIIVVAMVLVLVGPFLALLALAEPPGRPSLLEPAGEPAQAVTR